MQKRELLYNEGRNNFSSRIKGSITKIQSSCSELSAFESVVVLACYSVVFSLINMIYLASSSSNNAIHNIYKNLIGNFEMSGITGLANWGNIFVIGAKAVFIESLMLMSFIAFANVLSNKTIDFKKLIVLVNISYVTPIMCSVLAIVVSAISIEVSLVILGIAKIIQYILLYGYSKELTGVSFSKSIYVYPLVILSSELICILYFKESIYTFIGSFL